MTTSWLAFIAVGHKEGSVTVRGVFPGNAVVLEERTQEVEAVAAFGEVAEWSNAPVLKTGRAQVLVGSNPTLSAIVGECSCK